jgi:HEAT repeat protein
LLNGDPRLRANAIEGSWGSKSQTAIRLMEASTSDENPRVVANAFIGLHAAGCAGIPQRVLNLSRSHAPGHRSAAAWTMGKLGHPEFIERLTNLIRDGNPQVRSTAVRALGQISRAEARRMAVEQAAVEICRVKERMPLAAAPKAESEALNLPVPGFATRFDRKK